MNLHTKSWLKRLAGVLLSAIIGFTALAVGHSGEAQAATPEAEQLLSTGETYLGVPYRFGAPSGLSSAFDCSSFTQYIFKENGIDIPRTSVEQANKGTKVGKAYLSKGDLVFFSTSGGSKISHVAIYAGNNKILHAASSTGVTISSMDSAYWSKNYVTARRVLN